MALAADLRHALVDQDVRKIDDFTDRYRCAVVPFEGEPDPFMNLNRPEDFAIAQAHILHSVAVISAFYPADPFRG